MSDARQQALAAIAARWAEEERLWRLNNPGKVRFYLEKAQGEPPTFSEAGQVDLRKAVGSLKHNQIEVDAPFMTLDAADAVGGYTGEIAILISAVSPIVTAVLVTWLQGKAGRKVRLKDGDVEIEAQTVQEVKDLYALALEQRVKQKKD